MDLLTTRKNVRTLKRLAQKLSLLYVCYIHSDEIQSTVTELADLPFQTQSTVSSVSLFPTT